MSATSGTHLTEVEENVLDYIYLKMFYSDERILEDIYNYLSNRKSFQFNFEDYTENLVNN